MDIKTLTKRVLEEVQIETVLVRYFGYQENGGRCPFCGNKHCIRATEFNPGEIGFECDK